MSYEVGDTVKSRFWDTMTEAYSGIVDEIKENSIKIDGKWHSLVNIQVIGHEESFDDDEEQKIMAARYAMNITCPFCGEENEDSWELELNDGEEDVINCDCGNDFIVTAHIEVTYTSEYTDKDKIKKNVEARQGKTVCPQCGIPRKECVCV